MCVHDTHPALPLLAPLLTSTRVAPPFGCKRGHRYLLVLKTVCCSSGSTPEHLRPSLPPTGLTPGQPRAPRQCPFGVIPGREAAGARRRQLRRTGARNPRLTVEGQGGGGQGTWMLCLQSQHSVFAYAVNHRPTGSLSLFKRAASTFPVRPRKPRGLEPRNRIPAFL